MRPIALALGAAAVLAAGVAFAQYPDYRNDPDWARREQSDEWRWQHRGEHWRSDQWRDERSRDQGLRGDWECWNPHAGHFEGVRPNEVQDDLDFSRCRPRGEALQRYPSYGYGWR